MRGYNNKRDVVSAQHQRGCNSGYISHLGNLSSIPSPFRFKFYNAALVIVTQPKKRGISNPTGQDKSAFISHSNIQNHFCLKLSSFGELNFLIPWVSARVLCVCVWQKSRSRNSNSTKNRGISNPIGQDKSVLISYSNIQKHFCLKLNSSGKVKF